MATFNPFDHVLSALKIGCACACVAVLAACATTDTRPAPQRPPAPVQEPLPDLPEPEAPEVDPKDTVDDGSALTRDGLTPPHMKGRDIKRMALLLPFSAQSERLRAEAASMLKAAELAVFQRPDADILLIAVDTQGTPGGAAAATQTAIKSGVDVILGPILSASVSAASAEARRANIPVIAFSTDQNAAGDGTYLLSFPPEAEVRRIVDFTRSTGATRFAFLGPDSAYGRRVLEAYRSQVDATGGEITAQEIYAGNDIAVMDAPARKLAAQFRATEEKNNALGADEAPEPMAFEALILPEGGTALRSLAPLLLYYEDRTSQVQFLGTGLWQREDTVREPALRGGIFAGPDQEARQPFLTAYDRTFAQTPSRLASLAHDAVTFGTIIADGDPRGRRARAEDPQGFYGTDGLIRFRADGTPDRGLAVYQIQNGRFVIIDPAPKQAIGPS